MRRDAEAAASAAVISMEIMKVARRTAEEHR